MINRFTLLTVLGFVLAISGIDASADDDGGSDGSSAQHKFRAAENVDGPGFFWVDTTTGQLWMVDTASMTWVYCGAPKRAQPAPIGTYIPRKSQSGPGVFILNTATGQGWWSDGQQWKELGFPVRTVQTDLE